ncbi:WD40 repeat 2 [Hirsutella rhossiliensis]|uniref:WD40 repeat 2 n=1 Tax=Hirsutella rhossiliensis TaxID=111463 RepID=A0A9P8SMM0_9HYPO|nr:WD40 repeat 2 [Hirsutella rhossiliensis]KAH0967459.1 WD40 repeat 2 [Hirsutella rhossiliensis]
MDFVDFGLGHLDNAQQEQFKQWVRSQDERPTKASAIHHLYTTFGITIPLAQAGPLIDSALGVATFIMEEPWKASAPEPDSESQPQPNPTSSDPLRLPGYGLSIAFMPSYRKRFPVLVGDGDQNWAARTLLIREVCMLKLIEDITNKPEWWRKVRDPIIAANWKKEACQLDWRAYRRHADFTPAMADACMEELRKKADLYQQTGLIPVLDYSACVVKSDRLFPQDLVERLKAAVAPLENVPEDRKDWHPGSHEKVLDLVHPSLWPLVYGRSRILRHQRIGIEDCLDHYGRGFVWLPCDVVLGEDGSAKIESYINNLHPVEHADLYLIINGFIEKALPAWDIVYRWVREFRVQRLMTWGVGRNVPIPDARIDNKKQKSREGEGVVDSAVNVSREGEDEHLTLDGRWQDEGSEEEDEHEETDEDEDEEEEESNDGEEEKKEDSNGEKEDTDNDSDRGDDPGRPSRFFHLTAGDVKSSGFFNGASRIQVIAKLANIHLTPEKPSYKGGSWHIEGQLNEHICATALFYYDSDNITESRLAFRTAANAENLGQTLGYMQNDDRSIERAFAIRSGLGTLQDVGSVLTRPGRAIFFPNLFQHRVEPFSLADRTRPGHRKILALFLVDPAISVISTANVPPQQRDWWPGAEQVRKDSRLPAEVREMIVQNVDVCMGDPEAKRIREQLMVERTVLQEKTENNLKEVQWSFCEH